MKKIELFNKTNILNFYRDILITLLLLFMSTLLSFVATKISPQSNMLIALIYILFIVLIARFTSGYILGIIASLISVVCINYLFTYPYFKLNFTIAGYPITFILMLTISLVTSATATNIKKQSEALKERERLLMEADKEKMRAMLLRSISHDLRTPLTSIIGSSNSFLECYDALTNKDKLELVTHIYEDASWLLHMVENILSITRIQEGTANIIKSSEPIEEVISEGVQRVQKRFPNSKINVKLMDDFIMVPMDALLIEQVIINLIQNAIEHSNSSKPIDVFTTDNKSEITVHVKDYGTGISNEFIDSIFNKNTTSIYYSSDRHKGMGLGLSICQTIISAHKGTINAQNHKDGAEFYFTLPKEENKHDK